MRVGKRTVAGADHDLVDIVAVAVCRSLVVGCRHKAQRASRHIDREQRGVNTADDCIGQRSAVRIDCRNIAGNRTILERRERARRDQRGGLIDVGYSDCDLLVRAECTIARADNDIINVVAIAVGRRFVVRRGNETEGTGRGIDGEQSGVRAADDRVTKRGAFWIDR